MRIFLADPHYGHFLAIFFCQICDFLVNFIHFLIVLAVSGHFLGVNCINRQGGGMLLCGISNGGGSARSCWLAEGNVHRKEREELAAVWRLWDRGEGTPV